MNRLRELRESYKLSQQNLADELGLTQQKIYAYENDVNQPDIATMILLANYFDTSVDYLVGNTAVRRKIDEVKSCELNQADTKFLNQFRALPPKLWDSLWIFMETLTK